MSGSGWQSELSAAATPTVAKLPRGRYYEDGTEHCGLDLRPDFIVDVEPGIRIIFDAKYYTSDSLPGSSDVLKQLAYSYFQFKSVEPIAAGALGEHFSPPRPTHYVSRCVCLGGTNFSNWMGSGIVAPCPTTYGFFRIDYRALAASYLASSRWECTQFLDQIPRERGEP